jgi:uncharacterized OB-fold protein
MEHPAPPITRRTKEYWLSGADGVLRLAQCQACRRYIHPPKPICPQCHGRDIAFTPVSGRGKVHSYTINRYQWSPGMAPPYVIADIAIEEQEDVLILSNVVGLAPEAVRIGQPVSVAFERAEDTWIPVFRP